MSVFALTDNFRWELDSTTNLKPIVCPEIKIRQSVSSRRTFHVDILCSLIQRHNARNYHAPARAAEQLSSHAFLECPGKHVHWFHLEPGKQLTLLEESYFTYSEDQEPAINHDIHWRPGIGADGTETYMPRTVIYDLKGGFGSMAKTNALYNDLEEGQTPQALW